MNKQETISNYLDVLIPNPTCELNYYQDYELVLAVMLSAQTTDKRVNKVTNILFEKYKTLKDLKNSTTEDIENIIRSLGSFHKKSHAIIEIAKILDEQYNDQVPNKRELLEELPMVGRKTASVILSVLFNQPNIAVDTHVARVAKRLGLVLKNDNVLDIENKLKKIFPKEEWSKLHHQLVLFGRYYCQARNPKCNNCKLNKICKNFREDKMLK